MRGVVVPSSPGAELLKVIIIKSGTSRAPVIRVLILVSPGRGPPGPPRPPPVPAPAPVTQTPASPGRRSRERPAAPAPRRCGQKYNRRWATICPIRNLINSALLLWEIYLIELKVSLILLQIRNLIENVS